MAQDGRPVAAPGGFHRSRKRQKARLTQPPRVASCDRPGPDNPGRAHSLSLAGVSREPRVERARAGAFGRPFLLPVGPTGLENGPGPKPAPPGFSKAAVRAARL